MFELLMDILIFSPCIKWILLTRIYCSCYGARTFNYVVNQYAAKDMCSLCCWNHQGGFCFSLNLKIKWWCLYKEHNEYRFEKLLWTGSETKIQTGCMEGSTWISTNPNVTILLWTVDQSRYFALFCILCLFLLSTSKYL